MTKDKLHYCPKCEGATVEEKTDQAAKYWYCPRCRSIFKDEPPFREIDLDQEPNSELKDPHGWLSMTQVERLVKP